MPAGGLVTAGAIGLTESVIGLINKGKANRNAAKLQASRPKYSESPYYKDQISLAKSELSTGMSGEAKTAYEQGIDRDLSGSLSAILKGGGDANNVATVFDSSQQGRQRLAMMKDNLRLNQINNVVRAEQLNTEEREKAFQFNGWAPWADEAKANAAARTAAEGQIMQGVNTLGSSVIRGASVVQGRNDLNKLFQSSPSSGGQSGSFNGDTLPQRAGTGATRPDTGSLSPAFISPNTPPMNFNDVSNYGLPDISTQE